MLTLAGASGQPGPHQPSGHSAGGARRTAVGPRWPGLSALSGCARAWTEPADAGAPPGWGSLLADSGHLPCLPCTQVSPVKPGDRRRPPARGHRWLHYDTDTSGRSLPEEATGASWGGEGSRLCQTWPCPPIPGWGLRGIANASSSPPGALLVHVALPKRQFWRTCHVAGLRPRLVEPLLCLGSGFWSRQPVS